LVKFELTQIDHYLSGSGQQWDNMHVYSDIKGRPGTYVQGVALTQMTDKRKLKFEAFPGKTAAQVTGFTTAAQTYER